MEHSRSTTEWLVCDTEVGVGIACSDADQVARVIEKFGVEETRVREVVTVTTVTTREYTVEEFMGMTLSEVQA